MNKPISSLFVFSVVYCVVFRQSLNRLGENRSNRNKTEKLREKNIKHNRNTGYPALDPTANEYFSGSAWEVMYLCFSLFLFSSFYVFVLNVLYRSVLCFIVVCLCVCSCCSFNFIVFYCKCKSLSRLGENIQTNRNNNNNKTEKLREQT